MSAGREMAKKSSSFVHSSSKGQLIIIAVLQIVLDSTNGRMLALQIKFFRLSVSSHGHSDFVFAPHLIRNFIIKILIPCNTQH